MEQPVKPDKNNLPLVKTLPVELVTSHILHIHRIDDKSEQFIMEYIRGVSAK